MQTVTDDILLDQLKTEDSASFTLLYKFYFPSIASYVKQNHGNAADAEDIFQECIVVLLQKVRQPDFVLTASLKTYLYAIAKNLWLKRLRNNVLLNYDDLSVIEIHHTEAEPTVSDIDQEKSTEHKVGRWLQKITLNCQRILKAIFFYEEPMESLMVKMGWKNKHTAANQKYKCLEQVKKKKDER